MKTQKVTADEFAEALKKSTVRSYDMTDSSTSNANDMVNSPDHYQQLPEEVIVYIDKFVTWLHLKGRAAYYVGTTFKYLLRFPWKGHPARDLRKAAWFLTRTADYIDAHGDGDWYDGSL